MKTSSNEIYLNGEYYKKNPNSGVEDASWKAEIIYKLLMNNNVQAKEVVEVGCGSGMVLVELEKRDKQIEKLIGYDISPQAFELAKKNASDKLFFYNEDLASNESIHTELLLMIDVLEHVDDYYGFLRKLKIKSKHFVFHVPLDLCCRTVLKPHVLLQQRISVGHIHYFTKEMLLWMLHDTGYEVIDWVYTKPTIDFYPADSFKRLIKKTLRNISFAINKEWSVKKWGGYSIMLLAK